MSTVDAAQVDLMLTELRLPTVKAVWQPLAERADKEGWPAARLLAALAEQEIAERTRRRFERHPAEAKLPPGKTLANFEGGRAGGGQGRGHGALVIDPKRDIVPLLWHFERQGADVRTIDMSTHDGSWILNLMAGPHSIEDDVANDRFLTAAKKILIRTSSLTPNHSAGVLGGVSNTAAEPYWGNAGARMAQTVLALVLLVLQHRDRLFGSRLAVRLGDSGNRARQALAAFALQAGFMEPQAAIEWQVDRARRVLAEDTDTPPEVVRTNFARRVRGSFPYHHESGGFRQDFEALKAACPEPADPETFNDATRDLLDQVLLASCRPLERDTDNGRPPDVPRRNVLALASIAMESMFSWEPGSYCQIWCTEGWSCDGPAVLGDLDTVVELDALDDLAELPEAA